MMPSNDSSQPYPDEGLEAVPLPHEHDRIASRQAPEDADGSSSAHRSRIADGPLGQRDLHPDEERNAEHASATAAGNVQAGSGHVPDNPQALDTLPPELRPFAALFLQRITQVEQHLHVPVDVPDVSRLSDIRDFDPELYKIWKRELVAQADHNRAIEREPIFAPGRVAKRGQSLALVVVIAVLALAGYALHLDHPWFAGILTAVDVVALAAVFTAGKSER